MEEKEYKILIVDDSMLNQEMLRSILKSDGEDTGNAVNTRYTVFIATTGAAALEMAQTCNPDLILLDIVMPGMNGFSVLSRLKESDSTRAIPVIIISRLSTEADEEKCFSLGVVDYIKKPLKKSITLARIKSHLKIVEQMRIIEQLSIEDPLTGILNRRGFDNQALGEWRRAIREKTPVSVLMVDVDHFKKFNDEYGHQQGDVALKTIAHVITATLRRPADRGARWGGEEFVALLPNTALPGAIHVAEQIRAEIEKTAIPDIRGKSFYNVTVSIGAATLTPSVDSLIEDLIGQADKAMYAAKNTGRNRVCSGEGDHEV